jgi:hypothetical protein
LCKYYIGYVLLKVESVVGWFAYYGHKKSLWVKFDDTNKTQRQNKKKDRAGLRF